MISPNNCIPAIVDCAAENGDVPFALFELGSILFYLAEKTGQFLSSNLRVHHQTVQWLMWQIGGVDTMMGQASHFIRYAFEDIPYGKERYVSEVKRLLRVMEKQLETQDYLAVGYSIADIVCYPWIAFVHLLNIDLKNFPRVTHWVSSNRSAPSR